MSTLCTSHGSRKVLYRKVEEAAQRVLDAFKAGNLPKPLAAIFICRNDDSPCREWSWPNQLIVAFAVSPGHSLTTMHCVVGNSMSCSGLSARNSVKAASTPARIE